MTQIKIEIKNIKEVHAALLKSPVTVSKHIDRAINRSILDVRNEAMTTTPVDSGRLRGSYEIKFSPLKGAVGPTAKYARWVHDGHKQEKGRYVPVLGKRLVKSYVKGNPFLQRAVNYANDKVNKNFEEGLNNALAEIAGSV